MLISERGHKLPDGTDRVQYRIRVVDIGMRAARVRVQIVAMPAEQVLSTTHYCMEVAYEDELRITAPAPSGELTTWTEIPT